MEIINRIGYYIQPGRAWYRRDIKGIKVFSIHHSASLPLEKTNDQMIDELAQTHYKNGWPGLSYHFVITPDGKIYQINGYDEVTWVDSVNWDCIGICLVGYFHEPYNQKPTEKQLSSLKGLLDELSTKHPEFPADQNDAYGHRERFATACPGDLLFPYVLEYRSKAGDVHWEPVAENPVNSQPASTPSVVPEKIDPVAPVEPLKYTETQYQEVVREKEEATRLLQEETAKEIVLNKNYSAFVALGYNTVDDVKKIIDTKDEDVRKLIAQVSSLKKQLEENHKEDYTALDLGTEAIDELKVLKKDWESVLIALNPEKPDIYHVLTKIDSLQHIGEKAVEVLEKKETINNISPVKNKALSNWITKLAKLIIPGFVLLSLVVWSIRGGVSL